MGEGGQHIHGKLPGRGEKIAQVNRQNMPVFNVPQPLKLGYQLCPNSENTFVSYEVAYCEIGFTTPGWMVANTYVSHIFWVGFLSSKMLKIPGG